MKSMQKLVTCATMAYLVQEQEVQALSIYEQAMLELQQQEEESGGDQSNQNNDSQSNEQSNVQTQQMSEADLKNQLLAKSNNGDEEEEEHFEASENQKEDNSVIQLEDLNDGPQAKKEAPAQKAPQAVAQAKVGPESTKLGLQKDESKSKSQDGKEIVVKKGDMDKLLRGEDVKDVLPGQKSNIPLHSGPAKTPTKLGKQQDKIDNLKSKIEDSKPKIKELKDKIEAKKEVIDQMKKEAADEHPKAKSVDVSKPNSDKNKLEKHPASKSINSMSNETREATVTIAPEVLKAEQEKKKLIKEHVEPLNDKVKKLESALKKQQDKDVKKPVIDKKVVDKAKELDKALKKQEDAEKELKKEKEKEKEKDKKPEPVKKVEPKKATLKNEPLPEKKVEEEKTPLQVRKEVLQKMIKGDLTPRAKHISDIYDGKKVVDDPLKKLREHLDDENQKIDKIVPSSKVLPHAVVKVADKHEPKMMAHTPTPTKVAEKHDDKPQVKISHTDANEMVKKLGAVTISRPSMPPELKKKLLPIIQAANDHNAKVAQSKLQPKIEVVKKEEKKPEFASKKHDEKIVVVKKDEKKPEFAPKKHEDKVLTKSPSPKTTVTLKKVNTPNIGKELKKLNKELEPMRKETNYPKDTSHLKSKSGQDVTVNEKQMDGLLKHLMSNPKGHSSDKEKSKVMTSKEKELDKLQKELDKVKQESKNSIKDSEHRSNIGTSPFNHKEIEKSMKKNSLDDVKSIIDSTKPKFVPKKDPMTKYLEKKLDQQIKDITKKVQSPSREAPQDKKPKIDLYKKPESKSPEVSKKVVETPKPTEKSHKVEEKTLYTAPKQIAQKHDDKKEQAKKPILQEKIVAKAKTAVKENAKKVEASLMKGLKPLERILKEKELSIKKMENELKKPDIKKTQKPVAKASTNLKSQEITKNLVKTGKQMVPRDTPAHDAPEHEPTKTCADKKCKDKAKDDETHKPISKVQTLKKQVTVPKQTVVKVEIKPRPTPRQTKMTTKPVKSASVEKPKPSAKINKSLELRAKSADKAADKVDQKLKQLIKAVPPKSDKTIQAVKVSKPAVKESRAADIMPKPAVVDTRKALKKDSVAMEAKVADMEKQLNDLIKKEKSKDMKQHRDINIINEPLSLKPGKPVKKQPVVEQKPVAKVQKAKASVTPKASIHPKVEFTRTVPVEPKFESPLSYEIGKTLEKIKAAKKKVYASPKKQTITLKKTEEPKPQKPKHEHISVPLVEDKVTQKYIDMNGKRIVEQAEGTNDDKKVQTMGEKAIKRKAFHKIAQDINNHSTQLGTEKKEDKVAVKDKVLKSIEKLTNFSKRVSGRDKKPKVLETIERVHDMAKKVQNGEQVPEHKEEEPTRHRELEIEPETRSHDNKKQAQLQKIAAKKKDEEVEEISIKDLKKEGKQRDQQMKEEREEIIRKEEERIKTIEVKQKQIEKIKKAQKERADEKKRAEEAKEMIKKHDEEKKKKDEEAAELEKQYEAATKKQKQRNEAAKQLQKKRDEIRNDPVKQLEKSEANKRDRDRKNMRKDIEKDLKKAKSALIAPDKPTRAASQPQQEKPKQPQVHKAQVSAAGSAQTQQNNQSKPASPPKVEKKAEPVQAQKQVKKEPQAQAKQGQMEAKKNTEAAKEPTKAEAPPKAAQKNTKTAEDEEFEKNTPKGLSQRVSEVENEPIHFVQQSPPFSHNLMIESENLKHSKKNHDNSLVKIHANAHTHSKANKDIVIHAKKDRKGSSALSQKEDIKVPQAMEPAGLMDSKDKKSESLPVYTEMKKHWVPNEDGVQDDQYKDAPTFAKVNGPKHLQSADAKNTTDVTVIPEKVQKVDSVPASSLAMVNQKHDIYTYSTTSDKPYGDRIVELVNEFHDTAEKANALNGKLEPTINKLSDQIKTTIENGSATGGSAAKGASTSASSESSGETLIQVGKQDGAEPKLARPARNLKSKKMAQIESKPLEAPESNINMKAFEKTPQSELEVVTLQIDQLAQIKTVAEKLKQLRDERDAEKKIFDEEAKKLTQIREQINEEKEELKAMYQKAGISIPKTINFNNLVAKGEKK